MAAAQASNLVSLSAKHSFVLLRKRWNPLVEPTKFGAANCMCHFAGPSGQRFEGIYFTLQLALFPYWSWWLNPKLDSWALLGGVFLAWLASVVALGTIRMAVLTGIESRRVSRALAETPQDGAYAAFVGELKPAFETMVSPCLAQPCVAVEFRVTVSVRRHTNGPMTNQYSWCTRTVFAGQVSVPYSIASSGHVYRVNAPLELSHCRWRRSSEETDLERARRFLLDTAASTEHLNGDCVPAITEMHDGKSMRAGLNRNYCSQEALANLRSEHHTAAGEAWLNAIEIPEHGISEPTAWQEFVFHPFSTLFKTCFRRERDKQDRDQARTRYSRPERVELLERVLRPGDIVCVQGVFSASSQSIEPDPKKAWRLVKGDPARLPRSILCRSAAMAAAGLSGLVIVHLAASYLL
ncbi:MAG: hypothetical protein KDB14_01150 [Planctomycetales bacterium]|nr:hypothetical protein [Planctomycetales bacterium]